MAEAAQPITKVVSGDGTGSLTFTIPAYYALDVESVLAHIDTGGAGDTIATLVVTSQAGAEVAAVPQGQAVSGGGTGRATWALRLAEEAHGGGAGGGFESFDDHAGVVIPGGNFALLPWVHSDGGAMLDTTNPLVPTVIAGGVYAITTVMPVTPFPGPLVNGVNFSGVLLQGSGVLPAGAVDQQAWDSAAPFANSLSLSMTLPLPAGTSLEYLGGNNQANGATYALAAFVTKVG